MTKFEEEVKRPANGPLTELNNNMQEVFSQYRKMRQYADYLEYELKQKDEHILKVENENSFMRDERTTFDSNGNSVEPIIPQQALPKTVEDFQGELEDLIDDILDDYISDLPFDGKKYKFIEKYAPQALPVVPEYVADAIAWDEQIDNSIAETLKNVFTFGDRGLKEAGLWIKNNPEKYIIARNIGYTVEKPQLFYLREKNTNYYLNKSKNNGLELVPNPYFDEDNQFTKQEIDSMQTGSYELLPVENGE